VADLTRFDFHALKFIQSDSIAEMSNEEVGQYILLLSEAWLGAKDASLPDSPDVLARKARCKKVSDRVLAQFPVVQTTWGPRRQNDTLYAEWRATQERLDLAKEYGRRGGEAKREASRLPLGTLSEPVEESFRSHLPITKPTQTDSTLPTPHQTESHGSGTFKTISIRYSSYFGVHHSKGKKHLDRYQQACGKYGENQVLEYFDRWASTAGWLKEKRDTNGLNFFWRPLEEMAEGDELRVAREHPEPEIPEEKVTEAIQENVSVRQSEIAKELEELANAKKWETEHRDEI
jgi:hypothetical protein